MNERMLMEDTFLQLATVLREKSLTKHVRWRENYQELMQAACDADRVYMELELTEQQRKIVDDMLDKRETATGRELAWSYVLGMMDATLFLRKNGFLDMFLIEDQDTEAA